jgi:FtsP/CotA-like multicopper oxidase with cupredoxin domain
MSITSRQCPPSGSLIDRRGFVIGAGASGAALGAGLGAAYSQVANASDYTLRIASLKLELAPGKIVDTFAYNGGVPGPVLRLREGQKVNIDVTNNTDIEDIVHWHGLHLSAVADGAMEEGSPMIQRGATQR